MKTFWFLIALTLALPMVGCGNSGGNVIENADQQVIDEIDAANQAADDANNAAGGTPEMPAP